jgi:iron complex outermembrane receptor protein
MAKFCELASFGAAVLALGGAARAADAPAAIDEVVVTATRRPEGVGALQSPVPVGVVRGEALAADGFADLSRSLEFLDPSVNYNRAATTATAASTRPVTLRGLSPDQVLVLVNGKRRHASAILNTNNSIGRGSAPVDLNMIPEEAIERVEILRDGAAAQYGSDAIAGVVNIILRQDSSGGVGGLQAGVTGKGDGADGTIFARSGFDLGGRGHLTLTGQLRHQDPTNRANVDKRFGRATYEIGDPKVTDYNLAFDAGYAPAGAGEFYLFGTGGYRESESPGGYRTPTIAPSLYPAGYVAHIRPQITDFGITGGWRGDLAPGWRLDLSHTIGFDRADFEVANTANLSLLAAKLPSPTQFDAGGVTYRQHVSDLLLTRRFEILQGLDLALGAQHRLEIYRIREGEPAASFGSGADGFPGFEPRNPVDADRTAYAGFVDLALAATRALSLGAAGRFDHYSDFGGAATWKASARYALTDWLALRADTGTGFRAPSMPQQYFSAVTNNLTTTGALVTVGTLPVSDPVARALGAVPLKPEKSRNWSAGFVLTPASNLYLTVDAYEIRIRDRIALSEQLGGAPVSAILKAAGITNFQQVRFFTNAADTTTRGVTVQAHWTTRLGEVGDLDVGAGYGRFTPHVDKLRANPVLPNLPLLATKSLVFLTTGQPADKLTFSSSLTHGPVSLDLDVVRFGQYQGADLVTVQTFAAKTLVDLSAAVRLGALSIRAGVLNLGDVYPDQPNDNRLAAIVASTGGSFPAPEEAPFGFNGRSWFVRLERQF